MNRILKYAGVERILNLDFCAWKLAFRDVSLVIFFICLQGFHLLAQPAIIFDTDIGSDCDDAGALAVLHKLADKNEVKILGTIFSSNANPYGIGTIAAINQYYGRGDLPLGQYQGSTIIGDPNDSYTKYIAKGQKRYGHNILDQGPELVSVYKKILQNQPDNSVTIVTVGHPVGLFYLVNDPTGLDLVKEKVTRWIAMTHTDEIPVNDWNFGKNGTAPYICGLLNLWPTDVYFSGAGTNVITGNTKLPKTSRDNPVRKSYELWGNNALKNGRSSWDQIAVLYAARPQYFTTESGELRQNDHMETYWTSAVNGTAISRNHYRIIASHTHSGPQIGKILSHFHKPLNPEELAEVAMYANNPIPGNWQKMPWRRGGVQIISPYVKNSGFSEQILGNYTLT